MTTELINSYTLRMKDTPLVNFDLYRDEKIMDGHMVSSYRIEITHIFKENTQLLPKNLPPVFDGRQLLNWIAKRKSPGLCSCL